MPASSTPEPNPQSIISLPESDELCTLQARRFLRRHLLIFDLFYFGIQLATRADEVRRTATKALAKVGDEKSLARLKEVEENPSPAQEKLNSFARHCQTKCTADFLFGYGVKLTSEMRDLFASRIAFVRIVAGRSQTRWTCHEPVYG